MSPLIHAYDINKDTDFQKPLNFNHKHQLQHTDKVYRATITSIIRLTEMEKLFHLRIIDDAERERFSFLPGQFLMLELPGFGEVPISISSSQSNKGTWRRAWPSSGIRTCRAASSGTNRGWRRYCGYRRRQA